MPLFSTGMKITNIAMEHGINRPPAAPCIILKKISVLLLQANPHSIDPTRKPTRLVI
jgi:hypothetical protein